MLERTWSCVSVRANIVSGPRRCLSPSHACCGQIYSNKVFKMDFLKMDLDYK